MHFVSTVAGPSPHCTDLMTLVTMMLAVSVRSRTLCCMTLKLMRFSKRVFLWKLTPAEKEESCLNRHSRQGALERVLEAHPTLIFLEKGSTIVPRTSFRGL
jgi:hypothetical protein